MKAIYSELADRFRREVKDLDRVVHRTLQAWERAKAAATDQDIYLDAAALNLHGFYSGLERLFELVARHLDRSQPSSETWHRDLLQMMKSDVADVRPALIDADSADAEEY